MRETGEEAEAYSVQTDGRLGIRRGHMEGKGREKAGNSRFRNLREFSWHIAKGLWYSEQCWRSRSCPMLALWMYSQ